MNSFIDYTGGIIVLEKMFAGLQRDSGLQMFIRRQEELRFF